jgi:hypothetical protein
MKTLLKTLSIALVASISLTAMASQSTQIYKNFASNDIDAKFVHKEVEINGSIEMRTRILITQTFSWDEDSDTNETYLKIEGLNFDSAAGEYLLTDDKGETVVCAKNVQKKALRVFKYVDTQEVACRIEILRNVKQIVTIDDGFNVTKKKRFYDIVNLIVK